MMNLPIVFIAVMLSISIAHADVTDGLVGWWKLDQGSGTSAADSSGNGNTGTLTNGPTWAAGKRGTAVSFDGVDDYVSVPNGGGLNNVSTGSIAMWVKWTGTQDAGYGFGSVLARQSNGQFSNNIISLTTNDPNTAKVLWSFQSYAANDITGATSPISGRWRHIVITFTSGTHKMYMDGVLDGSSATLGGNYDNLAIPLTIGAWIDDGGSYSTSVIDDVRIYNRALSAQEAYAIYMAGEPRMRLKGRGRLSNFKM